MDKARGNEREREAMGLLVFLIYLAFPSFLVVLPEDKFFLEVHYCWKYPNNFVRTVSLIKADFIHDCNGKRPSSKSIPKDSVTAFVPCFLPCLSPSPVSPLAGYSRFTILSKGLHLLITC